MREEEIRSFLRVSPFSSLQLAHPSVWFPGPLGGGGGSEFGE